MRGAVLIQYMQICRACAYKCVAIHQLSACSRAMRPPLLPPVRSGEEGSTAHNKSTGSSTVRAAEHHSSAQPSAATMLRPQSLSLDLIAHRTTALPYS